MLKDPTGEMWSPYYDKNGKFLGVDEEGFKGKIFITTEAAFKVNANKDGIANAKNLQENKATRWIKDYPINGLSSEAHSKIMTHILQDMSDINLSKLYNGKVSVLEKSEGGKTILTGFNDPAYTDRANFTEKNGQYRITTLLGELNSLGTVEAVKSYIGIHEYWGHGTKGIPGRENQREHQRAYQDQYDHWTYPHLSLDQQKEINNRRRGIWDY
jgi:hypothetical protein